MLLFLSFIFRLVFVCVCVCVCVHRLMGFFLVLESRGRIH